MSLITLSHLPGPQTVNSTGICVILTQNNGWALFFATLAARSRPHDSALVGMSAGCYALMAAQQTVAVG